MEYAYLITQLFVGPLLDKYSPRILTATAILLYEAVRQRGPDQAEK